MLGDPRRHGGCPRHPGCTTSAGQARMRCTAGVERTDQIQAVPPCLGATRPCPASTRQRRHGCAARRLPSLKSGGGDPPVAWRTTPERLATCGCAIPAATLAVDHAAQRGPLHALRDAALAPGTPPRAPRCPRRHRIAHGRADGPDLGAHPIGTDQARAMARTGTPARAQPPEHRHGARLADLTGPPQSRCDHHGPGHPHEAPLFLDASRLRRHRSQVPWGRDQRRLPGLAVDARARQPTRHRPLVAPKAATMAGRGQPCARRVPTRVTVSAEVCRRDNAVPLVAANVLGPSGQLHRLSWRAGRPIWPWPPCPLAGHARGGPHVVGGSMLVLRVSLGNVPRGGWLDPRFLYKGTAPRLKAELPLNLNRVITGDCLELLPLMPAASVDMVLTDPPYLVRYQSRDGPAHCQ